MQRFIHLTPNELATLGYKDLSLISETEALRIYHASTHDGQYDLIKTPVSTNPLDIRVAQSTSSLHRIRSLARELLSMRLTVTLTEELQPDKTLDPGQLSKMTLKRDEASMQVAFPVIMFTRDDADQRNF